MDRSFAGVSRLYGEQAAQRLTYASVMVVGVGGVGSWAAEALVRSGIGRILLVDMDVVAQSNINRQLPALQSTCGANKVDVLRARFVDINPALNIEVIDDFLTPENCEALLDRLVIADSSSTGELSSDSQMVVDAIDSPRAKAALIAHCQRRGIQVVVAGAAGGRTDALALMRQDLALTRGDALLANVRSRLRRDYGFPRAPGKSFGITAITSKQGVLGQAPAASSGASGSGSALACAGYGSAVWVTATMGMALAGFTVEFLCQAPKREPPIKQTPIGQTHNRSGGNG